MSLLALLVLAAQVGGDTPVEANGTPSTGVRLPLCPGVRVSAPNSQVPSRERTFSSRSVLELELRPRVRRDLPGDHQMQLKVFTPGGFLYQVITLPLGETAAAPDPPTEDRDPATRIQPELVARLPVAGTSITLSSLYGRWSVQPYLDSQPSPCGPTTFFTISE